MKLQLLTAEMARKKPRFELHACGSNPTNVFWHVLAPAVVRPPQTEEPLLGSMRTVALQVWGCKTDDVNLSHAALCHYENHTLVDRKGVARNGTQEPQFHNSAHPELMPNC